MAQEPVPHPMRSFRRGRRGLAEIVGTLMLVVIVVAAATGFSFFVASYQKQLQGEETQQHLRHLETGRVTGIQLATLATCAPKSPLVPTLGGAPCVNVTFVSGDVNPMNITDYEINGIPVPTWLFFPENQVPWVSAWMVSHGCPSGVNDSTNQSCQLVAPYQQVSIAFILPYLTAPPAPPIKLLLFTALADEFQFDFVAPVAIASTFFVETGSGATVPVFDGLGSFQPSEADNASLVGFAWYVNNSTLAYSTSSYLPEFECSSLVPGDAYAVTLVVTNTDGLTSRTSFTYV
jgi:flagellin-like protein